MHEHAPLFRMFRVKVDEERTKGGGNRQYLYDSLLQIKDDVPAKNKQM